tara:strand:+ start:102 stop:1481 length:1380 start_codon:yes stop_codon:yes gene_type:complete
MPLPFLQVPVLSRISGAAVEPADLNDGLYSLYLFEEGIDTGSEYQVADVIGGRHLDDSNNGYSISIEGGGTRGNRCGFGASSFAELTSSAFPVNGDRTFCFDINFTTQDTSGSDVKVFHYLSGTSKIKLEWLGNNKLKYTYNGVSITTSVTVGGQLRNVAFGHGDGKAFLYLDGTLVGESTVAQLTDTTGTITWLNTDESGDYEFYIDQCSVHARRLTAAEITLRQTLFIGGFHYQLDGSNDYVALSNEDTTLALSGEMSISAWIKADSDSGNAIVANATGSTAIYSFSYGQSASGKLEMWHTGAGPVASSTAGLALAGDWHHVVVTRSGSAGDWTVSFYVDAVAKGSTAGISTDPTSSGSQEAVIGRFGSFSGAYFDGSVADVRLYDDVLTSGEISWLKNFGTSGDDPTSANLVAHYYCAEGTGTVAKDSEGSSDGTLTNGPAHGVNDKTPYAQVSTS